MQGTAAEHEREMNHLSQDGAGGSPRDRGDSAGVDCSVRHVESEHPWKAIIETAEAQGCDLIAMGSHGRSGLAAVVLGSETTRVLTHSRIPVIVYR